VGALVALGLLLGLVSASLPEMAKANAVEGLKSGQADQVLAAADSLASSASDDAEALYLRGIYAARSPQERLALLKQSVDRAPTTKALRALANVQAHESDLEEAESSFDRALQLDPFNLRTLASKMKAENEAGKVDLAMATARRLVETESSDAFKYRAIPESVPTETYDARVFLAGRESDPAKKVALLKPAVEGYLKFNAITYPRVKLLAKEGANFIDMDTAEAQQVVKRGRDAAEELKTASQSVGDAAALETSTRALSELLVE
jgi:tetratricopeptide (TPR) repeat protein